ncbi:MAG: type II toxin-antitoxin system RelE/ParE family toxin [Pseudotabrizicola sp.]|uniref:type II toxin-antitoxin system RelE/ParE family toxin n=1 Tax=Pseudotabrizicola sp. TaxID=2939647 RepID=UPI00271E2886|nr:type II toxin-antitoxin system RelE/ParE family toxin [Pseudotabrizicola sp.]MDO9641209.1 type II toxin-antitoxin system RelE/ParE family toxin [Pseudotabrizicola sp.]
MRLIRHPLVQHDLLALVDHIVETTQGDFAAAARRLDEIDALLAAIAGNPLSGMRLSPPLEGWLVRHGGRGHRITIVFKPSPDHSALYVALVAFGAQDWIAEGSARRSFIEAV